MKQSRYFQLIVASLLLSSVSLTPQTANAFPNTFHSPLAGEGVKVSPAVSLSQIYDEVKTPYKYGMVVAPHDNYHKIDCPMVFREGSKWYMTYVNYNGKDGTDGRGYETWLAESGDLLHWTTLGRVLSYADEGWDMNQRAGYPALIDWTWGGSYEMASYKGRHWMSYFGGVGTGYEAVRAPLNIGMASTKGNIAEAHEWLHSPKPVLAIDDKDAQWWEKLTQYKSTVYWDKAKTLGQPFVMFYNAGGINPQNNLKAERIGIALSKNMTEWKRLPQTSVSHPKGNPVYYHEAPGIITGDAQIVKLPAGTCGSTEKAPIYVMFYFSAYNPTRTYNAFNTFAVSRDLVTWQDWDGEDLIVPSKPYDEMFAHKSYVLKHDGVVYHFYCAVNNTGQRGIAVATSVPMGRSELSFPEPEKTGKRTTMSLDKHWLVTFGTTTADSITSQIKPFYVDVPNNLDDYYGYRQLKHGNLHGQATYEKTFDVRKQAGKRYFVQFEGVGTYATITLNGHQYPRELIGRTSFTLDVTDYLKDGDNHLSVLADHPAMQTDCPWVCGGCSSEWGFSEGSQPFGIFRPVTLQETAEVRVEPFGVHVWNNATADSVFIDTEVKNYSAQEREVELISKFALSSGKTVFRLTEKMVLAPGETKAVHQQAAVKDVHRWSLEDPYLYTLSSLVKENGKTLDDQATPYGIRTISWPVKRGESTEERGERRDNRFYLNDKPVFINGTCDYEHLFGQSHAFSHEQVASRVKWMRQAGFNAFREAHQPHNLYYQQLLDEQGMLFWSQFSAHIWYDTPAFRDNFKRLLRRWIKERRNSPSIILWGLQNESVMPKDFTEECAAIIREMDPTCKDMRAITTCNGGEGSDWNVIQNWSGTYGGSAANYDKELMEPNQLLNGEYGAWRTLGFLENGGHKAEATEKASLPVSASVKSYTEDAFVRLLSQKAILAERVKDSVCGHFQWIFVSHENPGRVQPDEAYRRIDKVGPFNYKGLLTPWEQPTTGFHWYRNHYVVNDELRTKCEALKAVPTAADRNKDILKPADGYTYIYRLNCGGDAFTDSYGHEWLQDNATYSHSWAERFGLNPFTASQGHITDPVHGLEKGEKEALAAEKSLGDNQEDQKQPDAPLFQYFRWGRHELSYRFPVPDGQYRVELYFAEPWLGAQEGAAIDCEGQRIFDVAINGQTVVNDLDLWAEAGYAGACKRVVEAEAKDGLLTISFPEVKVGEAVISAIAIASNKVERGEGKEESAHHANLLSSTLTQQKNKQENISLSSTYWADLDKDVVEKYPKELLPKDDDIFPAVRYQATGQKKGTDKQPSSISKETVEWTVTPGVARQYMLRFRYKNTTGTPQVGSLKIVDSKGAVMLHRDMTFPATPNKMKTIGTSTDSQINAGKYKVTVSGVKNVAFEYLEVQ